jgi:hypothetical protein
MSNKDKNTWHWYEDIESGEQSELVQSRVLLHYQREKVMQEKKNIL